MSLSSPAPRCAAVRSAPNAVPIAVPAAQGDTKDIDRRTSLLDTALAVVVAAAVTAAALVASTPGVLDLLLIAAGALTLAGHRSAPRAVLAVSTLCMLGYVIHAHPGSWAAFPVLAAVHAAARSGHRRRRPGPRVAGDTVTAGTGLTGMRERVTALGGTLDAPRPAGCFSVRAELPLRAAGTVG
ncbi:hypothetical protein OG315_06585 [Streptomyces atratus]|nr:hypothetical protein [Streptomyces atratus]MCX5339669.1 hypothetical protein [Streptomyces atratus]